VVSSGIQAQETGTWRAARALTTPRWFHNATLLPSGSVLVTGGHTEGGSVVGLRASELYDVYLGRWTATGSMSNGRYDHTDTLLASGKVLAAGGTHNLDPVSICEVYDPSSGSWTVTGPLVTARFSHTATLLPSGKVLVNGGRTSLRREFYTLGSELYDPATGRWTATSDSIDTRNLHTATLLPSGKVLVAGGQNFVGRLASCELYDPATGAWSPTGPMSTRRAEHTATLLESGHVLVAGGFDGSASVQTCEIYDPGTGRWSATGPMLSARSKHTATRLPSGKVVVAGGYGVMWGISTCELYDPVNGTWYGTGPTSSRREGHSATLLPSGKVLISGGDMSSYELGTCETFDSDVFRLRGNVFNDVNVDFSRGAGEAGLANWRVYDDQNGNGAYNSNIATRDIAGDDTPKIIAAPVSGEPVATVGSLWMAGESRPISDVQVTLNIRNISTEPLVVTLISPLNVHIRLFTNLQSSGEGLTNTVFTAQAATPIGAGDTPFTGTFRPEGDLRLLNGTDPNGLWRLEVVNEFGADSFGTLDSWRLRFTFAEPSALSAANGDYLISFPAEGTALGNHRIREQVQSGWTQSAPGTYRLVELGLWREPTGLDFGNYRQNKVTGLFWNDLDMDAVKDAGEANLGNWVAYADLNNDGIRNSGTITAVAVGDSGGGMPKSIPDLGSCFSFAYVSGVSGRATDVDLRLDITHTWVSDLKIYLTSPSGQRVEVVDRVGGSGDNLRITTLNDEAATSISAGTAPFSGSFKPSNALSAFDGANPNGWWMLEVADIASSDVGTVHSWRISVIHAEPAATSATSGTALGTYTLGNLVPGTFPIREVLQSGWQQTAPAGLFHTVTLTNGSTVTGRNFGNRQLPSAAN
jgi:subtilisin-like proprotein convertase family protein